MAEKTPRKRKWTGEEVRQWYEATGASTYHNREDRNLFVKNRSNTGADVNWGNPWAYVLVTGLAALAAALYFLQYGGAG